MPESVGAIVEPYNVALGQAKQIRLRGSFEGLPLINQALGAFVPLTVRDLLQVIESIPAAKVLAALAAEQNHPPVHQPTPISGPTPKPKPGSQPTCNAERDLDNPGFDGEVGMVISGAGFASPETVVIVEQGQEVTRTGADAQGQYRVSVTFLQGTETVVHTVHAEGLTSGRVSVVVSFNI